MSRASRKEERLRKELYAELRKRYKNADAIIRWIENLNPPGLRFGEPYAKV